MANYVSKVTRAIVDLLHCHRRLLGLNNLNVGVAIGKTVKPGTGKCDAMVPEKRWLETLSRVKQFYGSQTVLRETDIFYRYNQMYKSFINVLTRMRKSQDARMEE